MITSIGASFLSRLFPANQKQLIGQVATVFAASDSFLYTKNLCSTMF